MDHLFVEMFAGSLSIIGLYECIYRCKASEGVDSSSVNLMSGAFLSHSARV